MTPGLLGMLFWMGESNAFALQNKADVLGTESTWILSLVVQRDI